MCLQLSHVISSLATNSRCLTDEMLETLTYSLQSVSHTIIFLVLGRVSKKPGRFYRVFTRFSHVLSKQNAVLFGLANQCFDAVGWAAGRASGL